MVYKIEHSDFNIVFTTIGLFHISLNYKKEKLTLFIILQVVSIQKIQYTLNLSACHVNVLRSHVQYLCVALLFSLNTIILCVYILFSNINNFMFEHKITM